MPVCRGWVEFCDACREMFEAGRCEAGGLAGAFGQKAEPLEYRAIPEPRGIADQLLVVAVGMREIGGKAIRDVLEASPYVGLAEHVDNRAGNIGDQDAAVLAPDSLGSEDFFSANMAQRESRAVALLAPLPERLRRHDDNVIENLLRQVPVFRRRAAADIAGRKERRHENPGIIEHLLRTERIERHGRIGAGADPVQPALTGPPGEALCRFRAVDLQGLLHGGNADQIAAGANDLGELRAAFRQ